VTSKVFHFPVDEALRSKNAIINYVNKHFFDKTIHFPNAKNIFYAVVDMLQKERRHHELDEPTSILLL